MADEPTVDLAFAGVGWIAAVHGYAIDQVPGVRISAVASRDADRAAASADRLGATACTYDELPHGARGVVVCTPPALHAEHALHAVKAGAGALVEKPLCTTLAEADALVAAAEAGATIAYAENLVHAPIVRLALQHAAQLGVIDVLEVRALQSRPTWGDFLTEAWGGGVLFDLGVHPLAIALLLAAPARPVEVRATLTGAADHPVDEHAEVHLAFDSGLIARVITSWRGGHTPTWDAQASSPEGVVRLELLPDLLLERNGVEVPLPGVPEGVAPQLEQLGYLPQMESFAL
ncbi:MAG: Gfo/Idh/MocA family oxidoreductase, partial [Acidimicrobiales bacterium]